MVVTSSRNGKTSPLSSMRRNGVSTADLPFYRSRDYRLTTGLPPVSRPYWAPEDPLAVAGAGGWAGPGKLPSGNPGGTCMANWPVNTGSGGAAPPPVHHEADPATPAAPATPATSAAPASHRAT